MKNKRPYIKVREGGSVWEGMGLPITQIASRLEFQYTFGIRAQLIWCDISFSEMAGRDKYVPVAFHYGWIDELERAATI